MDTSEPTGAAGRGPDTGPGGPAGASTRSAPAPGQPANPDSTHNAAATGTVAPRRAWWQAWAERPAARHLTLLVAYLAAGVAATWPLPTYLTAGHLPAVRDISGYVWDLWWTAHQVVHLGNPWFTHNMAAPAGIQLGFDTTMPLAGLIMTPVTLIFGPSASFSLLTIILPGLLCYAMYRAAALWLRTPGAIAAGALFGLSSMLTWQDWYHLNIALGTVFLPLTLEAAVRLRRHPRPATGIILGLVLGACILVNQESAVMAAILAAAVLLPWLAGSLVPARASAPARAPLRTRLTALALGAAATLIVASPQLIAMAQQALDGGTTIKAAKLAGSYGAYGASLPGLFSPSPQVAHFGLHGLAGIYSYRIPNEGVLTYGLVLSLLAVGGLVAAWRSRSAWLLALLWLGGAALSLGSTLIIGSRVHVPLPTTWDGARMSLLMPYTWLVHLPGLSALREADRLALLGLVGAALLAGRAVDWLAGHARVAIAVVAAAAILEAGWTGAPSRGLMPTNMAALDRPIAADHSGAIVLDIPFGLRGGLPLYGSAIAKPAILLGTRDGHPRAISYTSWVPKATTRSFTRHPFYTALVAVQDGHAVPAARLAAARRDVRGMRIGWVLVWSGTPRRVITYLTSTGFTFDYRADRVSVYRPSRR